ncbi:hypothetical protein [Pyxidicoccus xibeiensis]|uniref:hypothetical protein n=1 Tax=Pyxidicoccus xibeiensis TaxID=2906759 RepID=UPI0020A73DDD|nr:hypothetical protein [Pyxidicoccus xibeiensis]MCP3137183.1 hypothetical protein [Pyxidicoccus xibeiensis]
MKELEFDSVGYPCPCGRGEIEARAVPGRRMGYLQIPDLEVPSDLPIPTCPACGEAWMGAVTTRRLEDALRAAHGCELTRKAERAIETLRAHIPQRNLEQLIGVSGGWLSKVKNGHEPSASLTALLMLLAADPRRVEELQALWTAQPPSSRRGRGMSTVARAGPPRRPPSRSRSQRGPAGR